MSDRHLRILSDAARTAARRLRDHQTTAESDVADDTDVDEELERSADRAHQRFTAAVRRRATTDRT